MPAVSSSPDPVRALPYGSLLPSLAASRARRGPALHHTASQRIGTRVPGNAAMSGVRGVAGCDTQTQ
jgi:hypothetical protein